MAVHHKALAGPTECLAGGESDAIESLEATGDDPEFSPSVSCREPPGHPDQGAGSYGRKLRNRESGRNWRRRLPPSPFQTVLPESHQHYRSPATARPGTRTKRGGRTRRHSRSGQKLADANPAVTEFPGHPPASHGIIGLLRNETGHKDEALRSYTAAPSRSGRSWPTSTPPSPEFRPTWPLSHGNIGLPAQRPGDKEEALWSTGSTEIGQKLADANPAITEFQAVPLRSPTGNIGNLLEVDSDIQTKRCGRTRGHWRSSEKLADANPAITEFQANLALSLHNNIGLLQSETGHKDEARRS